jgi:uncharacterized protein YbcV (DUF1398 family)
MNTTKKREKNNLSVSIEKIKDAYRWVANNPRQHYSFPYLAEALRLAGVIRYIYSLPSCQCIFYTSHGQVVNQMEVLYSGMIEVPNFNQEDFLKVLRSSQMGQSTFPEFLKGAWESGVLYYEADLVARKVSYFGAEGESYIEEYPAVQIDAS